MGLVAEDPGMAQPTVYIVDDHEAFRAAARQMLSRSGYAVVGETDAGRPAVAAVEQLQPDVVLVDVQLPDIDGFEVARRLGASPEIVGAPAIVLVSTRDATDYGGRIRASGALGFITKSRLTGDTLAALLRGSSEVDQR
jgi:two-component system nitrate/nitrite response regulator NarL